MAYRRRQGLSKSSTFEDDIHQPASPENTLNPSPSPSPVLLPSYSFTPSSSSSSSLAAKAVRASAARRDSSLSFDSAFSSDRLTLKGFDAYGDDSDRGESKSGFWGVLAQKAKAILEDDISSPTYEMADGMGSYPFNISNVGQEGRTADLRTQMKRKGSDPEDSNQAIGLTMRNSRLQLAHTQTPTNLHETQLKASRDVAMATAAKAKLLLRELKTVKADLAFAKARCAQVEEENKLLRDKEGREKGENPADDDLIRLQLETLLAEKARLANENEIYSRENRFLREIVEYHQLTMQDVVYLDEGMEEVTEVYSIDTDGVTRMPSMSPRSSSLEHTPPASPPPETPSPAMTKEIFPVPHEDTSISVSDEHKAANN